MLCSPGARSCFSGRDGSETFHPFFAISSAMTYTSHEAPNPTAPPMTPPWVAATTPSIIGRDTPAIAAGGRNFVSLFSFFAPDMAILLALLVQLETVFDQSNAQRQPYSNN